MSKHDNKPIRGYSSIKQQLLNVKGDKPEWKEKPAVDVVLTPQNNVTPISMQPVTIEQIEEVIDSIFHLELMIQGYESATAGGKKSIFINKRLQELKQIKKNLRNYLALMISMNRA